MKPSSNAEETNNVSLFADLSILFITYNRSDLLSESLAAIRQYPDLCNVPTICTDDASSEKHINALQKLGLTKLILASQNQGIGANSNKGLLATDTGYILFLQDDWKLVDLGGLIKAITILNIDKTVGMVRLCGNPAPLPLESREANGLKYWICDHRSAEYDLLTQERHRTRVYADTPHVRRREIHINEVGLYTENIRMEDCEMDYQDRFDLQTRYFIAFISQKESGCFANMGESRSFRTSQLRYRIDASILRLIDAIGMRDTWIYKILRQPYQALQRLLVSVGVL